MEIAKDELFDAAIAYKARAEKSEAQLAECHRLSLLGGAKFGKVKAEVEGLMAALEGAGEILEMVHEDVSPAFGKAIDDTLAQINEWKEQK